MKRILAVVGLVACLAAAPAEADPKAVTLAEAVAMAQKNAVSVVRAEGQSRTAAAGVRSAYGAFLPSLSLSAGSSRQLGASGSTRIENGQVITVAPQPWSSSLGVSANVTLFDGGQRFFELGQARANRSSAEVGESAAKWTAALSAKQAFFDVLAARETQVAATAQLEQAEQQRVTAIAKARAKAATRSDSLRAENQLRSAQLAVLQSQTSRGAADAALARTIGSLEPVTAAETDAGTTSLALDESALTALVETAPLVRAARADLDAANAAKKGTWTAYLPSVTASWSRSGNAVGASPEWGADALDYAGSMRLSLSFPIFDQFGRESRTTQADVALRNAEAEVRDARLAAKQSLVTGLGAFRTAGQAVVSQTASVTAAEEDLRVQRQRYAVGGSTLLDVLTSQTQLDQARRDLIRARYDQRVAKAQIEALVGREL